MGIKLPIYYSHYRQAAVTDAYARMIKESTGIQAMVVDLWNKEITTYVEMYESREDRCVPGIVPLQTIKLSIVNLTRAEIDGEIIEGELVGGLTVEPGRVYAPFDEVIPPETDLSISTIKDDIVHLIYQWIMAQSNFAGISFVGSVEHP